MTLKIHPLSPNEAEALCHKITVNLPEYFGLPEVNKHYAQGVRSCMNFGASLEDQMVGLLSLNFPYPNNGSIYWMGVLRDFHRRGVGRALLDNTCQYSKQEGAQTLTVETLAPGESDENYSRTYQFYQSMGFAPLFNLKPAGYEWNMVHMVKSLDSPLQDLISLELDARAYGFDWPDQGMIIDQAISECEEIREAIALGESDQRIQEEIGDLLHTAISLCVFSGYDPNETLTVITQKFGSRMVAVKALAKKRGLDNLKGQSTEFMLDLWGEAKELET